MKRVDVGAVVELNGRLARVVGIATGRTVILRHLDAPDPCPACGMHPDAHLLEDSPLFQDGVRAVTTVVGQ